jgi:large subunit ribosomal protein L19
MATVEAQLRAERDPTSRFTSLFSRNSKDRIPPGSVVLVETYTNGTKSSFSTFAGILIAIRRRGLSSSFVLRNIVSKLGVEIRFNLYSPLLKDIKIVQKAVVGKDDKTGKLRRTRRAKLYYLRGDDRKLAGIGKSIAALRTREEAEKTSRVGRRPAVRDRR